MSYRVIQQFYDLQDDCREYLPGDTFPREGFRPDKNRIEELASSDNRRGFAVIEQIEEDEQKPDKPVKKVTRKRVAKNAD